MFHFNHRTIIYTLCTSLCFKFLGAREKPFTLKMAHPSMHIFSCFLSFILRRKTHKTAKSGVRVCVCARPSPCQYTPKHTHKNLSLFFCFITFFSLLRLCKRVYRCFVVSAANALFVIAMCMYACVCMCAGVCVCSPVFRYREQSKKKGSKAHKPALTRNAEIIRMEAVISKQKPYQERTAVLRNQIVVKVSIKHAHTYTHTYVRENLKKLSKSKTLLWKKKKWSVKIHSFASGDVEANGEICS